LATDKKITLTNFDGTPDSIEIPAPIFGYTTTIQMALDIQRLGDKQASTFDHGIAFDIRTFRGQLALNIADQLTFNDFLRTVGADNGRAQDLKLDMITDSGFFPLGPDKGDKGTFTVSFRATNKPGIGSGPYKHFPDQITMVNVAAYPAYSLPSEIGQGNLTIGTISGNRFPPDWFEANTRYSAHHTILQGQTANYVDQGVGADSYSNRFEMVSNHSKAAAVIDDLVTTQRGGTFNLIVPADSFAYGRDKSSSGTYVVQMLDEEIEITHETFNRFRYGLNLNYVSGP